MKTLSGTIVSLKMPQTAVVEVARAWQHPIYKKYVKRTKRFACHYASDLALELGQTVTIVESRPLSRTKHFVVVAPGQTAETAHAVAPAAQQETK